MFEKGDRVEMTEDARRIFARHTSYTGTVVTEPRSPLFVTVLRDGCKNPERWHVDFWQKGDHMKLSDIQQAKTVAQELVNACQYVILRAERLNDATFTVKEVYPAAPGYDHMIATAERLKPLLRKFRKPRDRARKEIGDRK